MLKVSFVTVNFNNHEGLSKTLCELKKVKELLTTHQIELILVDGGSNNDDMRIIDKYRKYLDIVIIEKDKGIYDAMNKGIASATGDFINFMNSGDIPIVSRMVPFIENLVDLNSVHCGYGIWTKKVSALFTNKVSSFWLKMPNHQAMFIPLKFHKKNYYNLEFNIAADLDLKLKAYSQLGFTIYDSNLVICEPGGTSQTIRSFRELLMRANEIKQIAIKNNGSLSGYVNYLKFIIWHSRKVWR